MKLMTLKCTPGYPVSGGIGAFPAGQAHPHADFPQLEQQAWRRIRNADAMRVQTVITTDVPGLRSAPPFVRRP
jgi:hypothetical protein